MDSATHQGTLWGAAARDWAELQEPTSRPVWEAMLEATEVGEGTRFLDAGCGGGGASILAAERGAHVTGLDASAAMVDVARERVPGAVFHVGRLQDLPFPDRHFDVVFASLCLMFADDPEAALREFRRVAMRSGRIAVAVWGRPEACDMLPVFRALKAALPEPPPGPGPFALSAEDALERLMEAAGLEVQTTGEVDAPFIYDDFEALWRAQSSAGPFQGALRTVGEDVLREALHDATRSFRHDDGSLRLDNRFRYVVATSAREI